MFLFINLSIVTIKKTAVVAITTTIDEVVAIAVVVLFFVLSRAFVLTPVESVRAASYRLAKVSQSPIHRFENAQHISLFERISI